MRFINRKDCIKKVNIKTENPKTIIVTIKSEYSSFYKQWFDRLIIDVSTEHYTVYFKIGGSILRINKHKRYSVGMRYNKLKRYKELIHLLKNPHKCLLYTRSDNKYLSEISSYILEGYRVIFRKERRQKQWKIK